MASYKCDVVRATGPSSSSHYPPPRPSVNLASNLWRNMLNNKPGRNAPKRSGGTPAPEKRKYGCGELQRNAGFLTVPVRVPSVTGSGMADRDSNDTRNNPCRPQLAVLV